jgi:hypothetical protein
VSDDTAVTAEPRRTRLLRVAEHIRTQNWTAIGIDFLIVVLGVFVGIQVSNWNAAIADQRIAERYLVAIADDVRSDINELGHARSKAMTRIGTSAYLLREAGSVGIATVIELTHEQDAGVFAGLENTDIPEADAPPPEQRGRLWSLAIDLYLYDANRSAYDALVGSGRIDLIDDPRVVRALREYYYLVDALTATQIRSVAPVRLRLVDIGIDRGYSAKGVVDEKALVERLKSDPPLAAAIATSREIAGLHLVLITALERKAHELVGLLEEQRSRSGAASSNSRES